MREYKRSVILLLVVNLLITAILAYKIHFPTSKPQYEDLGNLYVVSDGEYYINGEKVQYDNGYPYFREDGYAVFNYVPSGYLEINYNLVDMECSIKGCIFLRENLDKVLDENNEILYVPDDHTKFVYREPESFHVSIYFKYNELSIVTVGDTLYCNSKDSKCHGLYLSD